MSHQIEAIKEKRGRWSKEADEAALAMQQYQQLLAKNNANNSVDVNMTNQGSIFNVGKDKKVEGVNGAGAASTSSNSTLNNNGGSETQYDAATQNTPTGPITQTTGSGTVATSSALTDAKSGNNDSQTGDYIKQQREKVKKEFKDSENTFADYQGFLQQYLQGLSDMSSTNEGVSSDLQNILSGNNNTNSTNNTNNTNTADNNSGQNPTNPEDSSDPTKTDMAYKDPDDDVNNKSEEQQIMKKMEQDALRQNSLVNQYKDIVKPEEVAAGVT